MVVTREQQNFAQLGSSPHETIPPVSSASSKTEKYFWVGVSVVQRRNIREKRHNEVVEGGTRQELKGVVDYVYPEDVESWVSPTYLLLQKAVTMPPLGESIHLNQWTYNRLVEQMPEGSLLTSAQGGEAVAEYLKEQIKEGVSLVDLSKGKFELQPTSRSAQDVLDSLSDDEVGKLLAKRGMGKIVGKDKSKKEKE